MSTVMRLRNVVPELQLLTTVHRVWETPSLTQGQKGGKLSATCQLNAAVIQLLKEGRLFPANTAIHWNKLAGVRLHQCIPSPLWHPEVQNQDYQAEIQVSAGPYSLWRLHGRSQPLLLPVSGCFQHWHSLAGGHIISISTSIFTQPSPLCLCIICAICVSMRKPLPLVWGTLRCHVGPVWISQDDLLISKFLNDSHLQRLFFFFSQLR